MSSYYSLNERNNIRSKRAYFEDEVQNEINNYIKQKKVNINTIKKFIYGKIKILILIYLLQENLY